MRDDKKAKDNLITHQASLLGYHIDLIEKIRLSASIREVRRVLEKHDLANTERLGKIIKQGKEIAKGQRMDSEYTIDQKGLVIDVRC